MSNFAVTTLREGAQWLSGRVLDSRQKGRGVEPHRRHWFNPGRPFTVLPRDCIWDVKNQIKQTKKSEKNLALLYPLFIRSIEVLNTES